MRRAPRAEGGFGYFSQPYYARADYGYRGDWQPERLVLIINAARHEGQTDAEVLHEVMIDRNIVFEMRAELICIKPIRAQLVDRQRNPEVVFRRV